MNQQPLIEQQMDYYRARAAEYDQWFLRQGRYDRGWSHTEAWRREVADVQAKLCALGSLGKVLEFAPGTGVWTAELIKQADSVLAVDASAEMIAINKAKLQSNIVSYQEANIFDFESAEQFDTVFFGFWLSHVPFDRFNDFWQLVSRCLKPDGRFFFVDSLYTPESTSKNHQLRGPDATIVTRKLNDGREFDIVKIFHKPAELSEKLNRLGWDATILGTEQFFLHGWGQHSG